MNTTENAKVLLWVDMMDAEGIHKAASPEFENASIILPIPRALCYTVLYDFVSLKNHQITIRNYRDKE